MNASVDVLAILLKFAPAFSYIGLGWVVKRGFNLSQSGVANLLFYVCVPLMVFKGALLSDSASFMTLVALSVVISAAMAAVGGWAAPLVSGIIDKGVVRCSFSYFNVGWFGMPLAYSLLGEAAGIAMTGLYVGGSLFGNTIGYLMVTSNDANEKRESIARKLLKVPTVHAMLAGFALHYSPLFSMLSTEPVLGGVFAVGTLMTSVLGMGLVGMSVANVSFRAVAWRPLVSLLCARSVAAAVIVSLALWLMRRWVDLSAVQVTAVQWMLLLPIASNILVFTARAKQNTEFMGLALLFSTMLSCVMFVGWFLL